ncbi:VOC family protein [Kitasatospora sp. NPDC052896]|uniref:VOC family protein n=1 Tax=Kitasatospora sp. NPDC052896 TaxID=3364061 RepID=UPI0037CC9C13
MAGTDPLVRNVPAAPSWVSLSGHDIAALQAFYGPLLGWRFRPGPGGVGPHALATVGGRLVAGIVQIAARFELPVAWTTYFGTEDADRTAALVRDSGGTIAVGPLDLPGAGRVALVADPEGAVFGLWQGRAGRPRPLRRPGAPVWAELRARDAFQAAVFYGQVFEWDRRDQTRYEVRYENDRVVLRIDGRSTAAICGGATGAADEPLKWPHWHIYFAVTDADETTRLAVELGGEVAVAPEDSPYGRIASLHDPQGGLFSVIAMAPEYAD